jgi:methyl-accepting chemotaxis protein
MNALHSLTMALWQSTDGTASSGDIHWLMIFVGIIAFVSLVQLLAIVIGGVMAMKEVAKFKALADEVHANTRSLIATTTEIVHDLQPKIKTVSAKVVEITDQVTQVSHTVRTTVEEVSETVNQYNQTAREANDKTRAQVDHVDRIVSGALNSTEHLGDNVARGIKMPFRQAAAVMDGLKAGFEALVKNFTSGSGTRYPSSTSYRSDGYGSRTKYTPGSEEDPETTVL